MIRNKSIYILILLMLSSCFAAAQSIKYTIGGIVKDATTNEVLLGVPIKVGNLSLGVVTNEHGFYSITLPQGEYVLSLSYLGYKTKTLKINLNKNITKEIALESSDVELNEVVVTTSKSDANVSSVQSGVDKITVQEINKIPVLMGERDIIKTLQLLPGVKSAGEGSSGYYVRGGSSDQNSILLDDANLYNAAHLLGFFSTFNSDAIRDATLYKGAIPSQFGGRLSSVLDVQQKDGDNQKYHVGGGIGLISSKLYVEGPLQKGKSSFLISGRRTYADMVARLAGASKAQDQTLYFYDLNMKMNYILSDRDRIFLSAYMGRDKLSIKDLFGTSWGNIASSLRWNHMINNKTYSNTSLIFNRYSYEINLSLGLNLNITSNINDYTLKQNFQYIYSPSSSWRYGFESTYHDIEPGKAQFEASSGGTKQYQSKYSWENAIYASNKLKISDKLETLYGLRVSSFSVLGAGDFYTLDNQSNIVDTTHYKSGQFVKTYINLEPRVSLTYRLNNVSSVKASLGRTSQNMHLVSNSSMTTPIDRWESSTNNIKPETADQVSFGYFRNFSKNAFEFSVETYYKAMHNQIDFKDNANMYQTENIEPELLYGKGRAYGIEFLLKKKTGRLTGWIGYTLSKSEKKIDGINQNRWYNATQDRTHDISIVLMYDLSKKWSLSSTWVYYTGNAVTYPSGKYQIEGINVDYYSERNGYRAPAYHRLDLGATCILKKTKKFYSELAFSLYNAYGRENAYMIEFKTNENDPDKTSAYQYSLFRFVPSISWNFKF